MEILQQFEIENISQSRKSESHLNKQLDAGVAQVYQRQNGVNYNEIT